MRYFLVVGEASGDLHASNLMKALCHQDSSATFMYMGGPLMREVGGTCVVASEEMAYMGFLDVLKHLGKIRDNAKKVQEALIAFKPDVVICVDYASFSFTYILPLVRKELPQTRTVYYIPPKVWAWKKHRIRKLRSHTDLVFCIFPFEVPFFKVNNLPQATYVGNPTMESVQKWLSREKETKKTKSIAILCGSRISEIEQNLPLMLRVAEDFPSYTPVIAAPPSVSLERYQKIIASREVQVVQGDTYGVLRRATVALVTSGTATLETALLGTPQVVCYAMRGGKLPNAIFKHFFTISYISLVNLVAEREVVKEFYAGLFTKENISKALAPLLDMDSPERLAMLEAYDEVRAKLVTLDPAATVVATKLLELLK